MGSIKISQGETELKFTADIPDTIIENILNAQADIVAEKQRRNALTMLNEKGYSTGATARSVKVKRAKRKGGEIAAYIVFDGTRPDGKKAAEVAFINEYGSSRNSARRFIAQAIDSTEAECNKIAEDAINEFNNQ
jgi:hypothetical protein